MTEQQRASQEFHEAEDDFDLLTYAEAGTRLAEEIERVTASIARNQASGMPAEELTARLAGLRAAQERNRRPSLGGASFEGFFGYPAKGHPDPGKRVATKD